MPFKNFADQISKAIVKFGELFYHHFVDYSCTLVLHYLMNSIIYRVSWVLQFLQKGVEQGQESINGRKTGNIVSRKIYHCLFNILVSKFTGSGFIVLVFIQITEFFPNLRTNGVSTKIRAFNSFDRIVKYSHKGWDTFPGVVNHFSVCASNTGTQFL